jgi:hypothetical protein
LTQDKQAGELSPDGGVGLRKTAPGQHRTAGRTMLAVDDQAFRPDSPEIQLDEVPTQPVWIQGRRATVGSVVLTNDRILFIKDASGSPQSGLVGQLLSAPLDALAQALERAQVVVSLPEVTGGKVVRRRLVADLYEFTLADGSTCRFGNHLGERWEQTVHRLLTERHGRSIVPDGAGAWRVG